MSFWYEWYFAVKLDTSTMKRISKPHCLHRRFCQIMPIGNFLTFAYELCQQSSGKLMFSQVSVCHSVQGKGLGRLYALYDRSLYPIGHQTWAPTPPPFDTTDIWWLSLETCSNLYTWGPTPYWYWHLVMPTERAVRILLECCLVAENASRKLPFVENKLFDSSFGSQV